jgi:hypothetical protein
MLQLAPGRVLIFNDAIPFLGTLAVLVRILTLRAVDGLVVGLGVAFGVALGFGVALARGRVLAFGAGGLVTPAAVSPPPSLLEAAPPTNAARYRSSR